MSGCSKIIVSCDIISTDYLADADPLYPSEFLHSVVVNNFAHHEIGLEVKKIIDVYNKGQCVCIFQVVQNALAAGRKYQVAGCLVRLLWLVV